MSRVKSEIELKVEEMKLQIKADLDTYIKGCVSLQKNAVNYDNMILENAIQQMEYLKREVQDALKDLLGGTIKERIS